MADERDPTLDEATPSSEQKLVFVGDPSARAALFTAIAKATPAIKPIVNDTEAQIGNRRFKYATLDQLRTAINGPLAEQGIALVQFMTGPDELGNDRVTTIVAGHGAEIHSILCYRRGNQLKAWGMQTTYIRRYGLRAVFGLDGSDDAENENRDFQSGPRAGTQAQPAQPPKPVQQTRPSQPKAEAPKEQPKPAPEPAQAAPEPSKTPEAPAQTPPAAVTGSSPGQPPSAPAPEAAKPGAVPPEKVELSPDLSRKMALAFKGLGYKKIPPPDSPLPSAAERVRQIVGKAPSELDNEGARQVLLALIAEAAQNGVVLPEEVAAA